MAVLVIDEVKHAVPLARALLDGGIDVMELTLRTPAAIDALLAIRQEVPEMLAGIGTILTPEQVTSGASGRWRVWRRARHESACGGSGPRGRVCPLPPGSPRRPIWNWPWNWAVPK